MSFKPRICILLPCGSMMSHKSLLVGWVVVAVTVPELLCCGEKEYTTPDGQCCPMCHKGMIVQRKCTPDSGTRCEACKPGTFMDKPNGLEKCFSCKTCHPGQGVFAKQNCTVTTDTVCDVQSGYYCKSEEKEISCSHAEKHSHCSTGQRVKEPGTRQTDTVCEDCLQGFFSVDGKSCKAWRACAENEVMVKAGSLHADTECSRSSQRNHFALTADLLVFSSLIVALVIRTCVTP